MDVTLTAPRGRRSTIRRRRAADRWTPLWRHIATINVPEVIGDRRPGLCGGLLEGQPILDRLQRGRMARLHARWCLG